MTIHTLGFIGTIFIIAVCAWLLRSWVESDPDPFYLNLTFFAFAGECILASELLIDGRLTPVLGFLFLVGLLVTILQIYILRAHISRTTEHYKNLLLQHRGASCPDSEVEHWARVLVRITGTDFSPGSYQWLTGIFASEPRARSRADAFSILPDATFHKGNPNGITEDALTIPATPQRQHLWRAYVFACLVNWMVFIAFNLFR